MKRILYFSLVLTLCFALCACGSAQERGSQASPDIPQNRPESMQAVESAGSGEIGADLTDTESVSTGFGFDFGTKTVLLNSGYEMPILGIGCYQLSNEQAENSVY